MKLKKFVAMGARHLKRWLLDEEAHVPEAEVPFDNTSMWASITSSATLYR